MSEQDLNTEVEVTTETETTEEVESTTESTEAEPAEAAPAEGDPAPFKFEPKFKVMDSEVEVPEWIAKQVTSEEQAKYVKDLMEKAHGLEPIKAKRDFFKAELQTTQASMQELSGQLKSQNDMFDFYDKLIQSNDMASFQKYTGISDNMVLERAAEILRYQELTPHEKSQYDRNIESKQRLHDLEFQQATTLRQQESQAVNQRYTELNNFLGQESYIGAVKSFDARLGEGAFMKEVIDRAALHEQKTNKSLSIEEAVSHTLKILGIPQGQSGNTTQQNSEPAKATQTQPASPQTTVVRKEDKPVIPNLQGGNKSVAKPAVKSLSELKKLAQSQEY